MAAAAAAAAVRDTLPATWSDADNDQRTWKPHRSCKPVNENMLGRPPGRAWGLEEALLTQLCLPKSVRLW